MRPLSNFSISIFSLGVILALLSATSDAQTCRENFDRLTNIKTKIQKITEEPGNKCLKLGVQNVAVKALASCYQNSPPATEVLDKVDDLISEYGRMAEPCEAPFQMTYLGFFEQRGLFCEMFNSRGRHPDSNSSSSGISKRIADAGFQCLADNPENVGINRITLAKWISDLLNQVDPNVAPKWTKSMLLIWFETFPYLQPLPIGQTATDISVKIQKNSGEGSPEWGDFLVEVRGRSIGSTAEFGYKLQPLDFLVKQYGILNWRLR